MALDILTIPCLSDNYAYAVQDTTTGEVALIDAPETTPILTALASKGWGLNQILVTHHHPDHINGLDQLRQAISAPVVGARADRHRLPELTTEVEEGDSLALGELGINVFDVSGHTNGHVAYYFPRDHALFTGDSLMVMGCGRLFEGDAETMWASLSKLMDLPGDTRIFSGHEYTAANAQFAMSIEPDNRALAARITQISELRARGEDTMGPTLALEMETNPFLRAGRTEVKAALEMQNASDVEVFAEIRRRKDRF